MSYQLRENNWQSFANHNSYNFESILTCDDTIFLAWDLITNQWIISKIICYSNGFTVDQYHEPQFFDTTALALDAFKLSCHQIILP